MRRRHYLALLAAGLGGCTTNPAGAGDPTGRSGTTTTDPSPTTDGAAGTTTGDPTTDPPATETTPRGDPPAVGERPPVPECPAPDVDDESAWRVVCDDPDAALTVTASTDPVTLPGTVTFTLRNRTDQVLDTNFYNWGLHKRGPDGDWHYLAPYAVPQPLMQVSPGGSHEWHATLSGELPASPRSLAGSERDLRVAGLGGGTYAFGTDGWFVHGESHVAVYARFEVDADPVRLGVGDAVENVRVEGDTVRGDYTAVGDGNASTRARWTLRRVQDRTPDRRLLPEQVVRRRVLRRALPLLSEHDATRVELTGRTRSTPPRPSEGPLAFRYRDATYVYASEELGGS